MNLYINVFIYESNNLFFSFQFVVKLRAFYVINLWAAYSIYD